MASVRKRNGKWQVQVRRKGVGAWSRTFHTRKDAIAWGRTVEIELDRGEVRPRKNTNSDLLVGDIIRKYISEIVPKKASSGSEQYVLRRFLEHPLARKRLCDLTRVDVLAYRDERLTQVKPSTFRRQLGPMRHAFEIAQNEWGIELESNPFAGLRLPPSGPGRDRRLREGEWDRLSKTLRSSENPEPLAIVELALETALRRSELLSACWRHVDLDRGYWTVPDSKTGKARTIPLTQKAQNVLKDQQSRSHGSQVFTITTEGFASAWKRAVGKAEIQGLTFHDLRHEAVSRLFEKGLGPAQVASISGHHDTRMLARYTHIEVRNLV